jgi:succinoglycan biosynthesis transport protein ExoP
LPERRLRLNMNFCREASDSTPWVAVRVRPRPEPKAQAEIGTVLAEIVDEATREYDLVFLDAPPLLGFAEPLQMASLADGVIVVARAGDTSRTALNSVITTLSRLRTNLVGMVLNEVHRGISPGYYYSYYNRYSKYYADRVDGDASA